MKDNIIYSDKKSVQIFILFFGLKKIWGEREKEGQKVIT